jgi:hypothetical protein
MFEIFNNRKQFWQWDIGQRLIVSDDTCSEVHFCNGTSDCSLVCEVYEADGLRFVNVPNILMQTARAIRVFAYVCNGEDQHTKREKVFPVFQRSKPDNYVYTETEIKNYATLERRISDLEKSGVSEEQISSAVKGYLEENPVQPFEPGNALELKGGVLSVVTTDEAEQDNTLPITSAGVHTIVGNIGAILDTI